MGIRESDAADACTSKLTQEDDREVAGKGHGIAFENEACSSIAGNV